MNSDVGGGGGRDGDERSGGSWGVEVGIVGGNGRGNNGSKHDCGGEARGNNGGGDEGGGDTVLGSVGLGGC